MNLGKELRPFMRPREFACSRIIHGATGAGSAIEPELKARRLEMVRLADVLRPLRIPVDVVVVSASTFKEWADTLGTVIYAAATEGRMFSEVA